jgi:hypothetical protein
MSNNVRSQDGGHDARSGVDNAANGFTGLLLTNMTSPMLNVKGFSRYACRVCVAERQLLVPPVYHVSPRVHIEHKARQDVCRPAAPPGYVPHFKKTELPEYILPNCC